MSGINRQLFLNVQVLIYFLKIKKHHSLKKIKSVSAFKDYKICFVGYMQRLQRPPQIQCNFNDIIDTGKLTYGHSAPLSVVKLLGAVLQPDTNIGIQLQRSANFYDRVLYASPSLAVRHKGKSMEGGRQKLEMASVKTSFLPKKRRTGKNLLQSEDLKNFTWPLKKEELKYFKWGKKLAKIDPSLN